MTRDQTEDRGQSNNIVFGYTGYTGERTNYGVMDRNGISIRFCSSPSVGRAVRAAIEFDAEDARQAEAREVREVSDLAVTPEEDEAFAKFFMHVG